MPFEDSTIIDPKYEDLPTTEAGSIRSQASLLLITATPVETNALHARLFPLRGHTKIGRLFHESQTYYVARFGSYTIAHVQCSMGSVLRDAALNTTNDAILFWRPKGIVMIGIAFGMNSEKQQIGEVLISRTVTPYDVQRVGKDKIIPRGPTSPAGRILLNRFRNFIPNDTERGYGVSEAAMISGEALVDNIDYRNELHNIFPDAEGGEMEGVGVFSSASHHNVEWIFAKAICDFADGNKAANKKEQQAIAARNAVHYCEGVFESRNAFDALGAPPVPELTFIERPRVEDTPLPAVLTLSDVTFDVYTPESEPYYLERSLDSELDRILGRESIWIHGRSGVGKTCAIRRALLRRTPGAPYLCLASCSPKENGALLGGLLLELVDHLRQDSSSIPRKLTTREVARTLSSLLHSTWPTEETVIHVDELPVNSDDELKKFAQDFFAFLILHTTNHPRSKVSFAISTIAGAKAHVAQSQAKILDRLRFLPADRWTDGEINVLIQRIDACLRFGFSLQVRETIVRSSAGSPRVAKACIRRLIHRALNSGQEAVDFAIQTSREV